MDTKVNNAPTSDTAQAVMDLNAKWRNQISDLMGLDKTTFQLAQGVLGLQSSDNFGLFLMSDAVPSDSAVGYYDGSGNRRSDEYGLLLSALLPETSPNALQTALGNYYTPWMTWQAANRPVAGDTVLSRLDQWGMSEGVDPGTLIRAKSAVTAALNSPLFKAQTRMWTDAAKYQQVFSRPGQPNQALYVYSATTDAATRAIDTGGSLNVDFDSSTASSDIAHTFSEGAASGFYSIFSGSADASFEKLDSKAASAGFTIKGRIGRYATLAVEPGGWFDSDQVGRALRAPDDAKVWDPSAAAGDWNAFFSQPTGALARRVSNLVLVSDYQLTVTSNATFSTEEFQQIKANATFGIWPFFSASASATHTTDVTLNSKSQLETTFTLAKNKIQIWGMTVQDQS